MKVTEIQGDLFAHLNSGDAMAHGCNLQGAYRAGVAGLVRSKYPRAYKNYVESYRTFMPGDIQPVLTDEVVLVFNMFTQVSPGACASTNYIYSAVRSAVRLCEDLHISELKMPRVGTGIGGLEWSDVRETLESVPSTVEAMVYYP